MKSKRMIELIAAALLPLSFTAVGQESTAQPSFPEDAVMIADFRQWSPDGAPYEGWAAGTVSADESGYTVRATGFGGVYDYLGRKDLSGKSLLCMAATVLEGMPGLVVELEDADGTAGLYGWYGLVPGRQVLYLPLDAPLRMQRDGSVPGIDWSNVSAMHLQVDDGEGENSYAVRFSALYAFGRQEAAPSAAQPGAAVSPMQPVTYRTERDIDYYEGQAPDAYAGERCRLDLYIPENKADFATVVWFHAGGLKRGARYIPGELMRKGFAVAAVDYRLNPRAQAPAYIEDAAAAVAWVFNNIQSYGGSPEKIVIAGASAGGYLSTMVGFDKKRLGAHGIDADRLAGIVSLSGQAITHVAVREEQGIDRMSPVVDRYAPLRHVRAGLPPVLIVTGDRELELLGRYEENAYLLRMLKLKGNSEVELIELKEKDHGGVERPGLGYLLKFMQNHVL